jgi:hypothetical protein
MRFGSSDPRPWCGGTVPVFDVTGVGSPDREVVGHKSMRISARLIRRMSVDNPLWGAPRIHSELLKLGFEVAQSRLAKYMIKRPASPSQGWLTFLRNHSTQIAAMDLFVVPSVTFELLCVFIIVRLARRDLIWINVTSHPTAEWITHQITEAFPWNEAPRYLIRDRYRNAL